MKKILLVEDDDDIRFVTGMFLEQKGYVVKELTNGLNIENVILDFQPDLILLDITLPGEDGRVICKSLKSGKLKLEIPVLLFSAAHNLVDDYSEYLSDGFITKPFEVQDLLSQVEHFML